MSGHTALEQFTSAYFELLEETFESVQGNYLDRGTSLFETLATISAEEASMPVSANCASLAAQVEHVRFYLERVKKIMVTKEVERVDWSEIWRTVEAVTAEEWEASKNRLRDSYQSLRAYLQSLDSWDSDESMSGAMGILVHTAYHLGEIRQALCVIKTIGG